MRYYVEINGESSLDIQGLAIESLPAISKPLMRSKREEIDGRNGDIITQLGFSAYDKTLKIGLWGNYDINEVITFFNQDGIITFSNEPDMYYNFTILNRIDFINQLEAFRKATITIHCQPFKYKEEETEELEIEEHQEEGTSFNLEGTIESPMQIDLKGNTNQVQLSGKNKFNIGIYSNLVQNNDYYNGTYAFTDNSITITANTNDVYIPRLSNYTQFSTHQAAAIEIKPNTTYTFSFQSTTSPNGRYYILEGDSEYNGIRQINNPNWNTKEISFTTSANAKYLIFRLVLWEQTTFTISNIQLEESNQATPYEQYCGGIPSPNPSYPQDIHIVSGNNDIVVCGKNLFDKNDITTGLYYYASGTSTSENWAIAQVRVQPNTNYYLSGNNYNNTTAKIVLLNSSKNIISDVGVYKDVHLITTNSNTAYIGLSIANYEGSSDLSSIQLEQGNQATTYEAYNGTTYPINLPSGMELCKIGTYQDYIYKEDDKWYLHKETGKLIINGTENPTLNTSSTNTTRVLYSGVLNIANKTNRLLLCNYLKEKSNYSNDIEGAYYSTSNGDYWFRINKSTIGTTTSDVNTWLSNHNVISYFALNTPTNTEITDTTLLSQLEAIYNAKSKNGTTNINQENNDLPFILDVSYLSGTDNITITNHGNYYSKPKLTLTGTGNIGIYLNDSQIFQVSLGTNETIIIDTDKMEAYYESTLKNRQVIGDYNSFKLLSGENTIRISGTFSKLQVDNYSRWI